MACAYGRKSALYYPYRQRSGKNHKNTDFFKIGIPFTLAAIIPAYIYLWIMYGI